MSGPCLCGDPGCAWCGPAQGYGPDYDDEEAAVRAHCEVCGVALDHEARAGWRSYCPEHAYVGLGLDEPPPVCPWCGGRQAELGLLGRRRWFRCEDCGITEGRADDESGR